MHDLASDNYRSIPVRWVHLVGGGELICKGGPIFFSNAEKQESKREQGGEHFSREARNLWASHVYGAATILKRLRGCNYPKTFC